MDQQNKIGWTKVKFLLFHRSFLFFYPNSPERTKMADVRSTTVNSDIFVDDVKTAIKAIKESKKTSRYKSNLATPF